VTETNLGNHGIEDEEVHDYEAFYFSPY